MIPDLFQMDIPVRWRDMDAFNHVNNASYMVYTGECGFQAVEHFQWPWQRMMQSGFAIYLRNAWLQYLQPAFAGEELEISTWIYDLRRATAVRHYQIHRISDGALLAQVNTVGVWVDLKTGQPVRIPEAMRRDFETHIAG